MDAIEYVDGEAVRIKKNDEKGLENNAKFI